MTFSDDKIRARSIVQQVLVASGADQATLVYWNDSFRSIFQKQALSTIYFADI